MGNILFVLWGILFLLTGPALCLSECVDLGRADSHGIQGAHTVIFYTGMKPVARITTPYCILYQDSIIHLIKPYTCDADRIIVDGGQCVIGTVSSAVTTPRY